ncbi:serine/threonine-protein kinase [Nonomuraea soli]|uniref:non-specific serine/threonine protein kinase n=1 Tax=Nonomuraea soli TaxID=1032476 RepID=A0A7W0CE47_9ACTN|nr:serine/threonine-protein kinase [Nonomuraea soli]MBA2889485.1 hypothetical protein [Nonomuraea soli]
MQGELAGRYRLLERLGEGGAGTVWRAHDVMLNRLVAVKQVRMPADPRQRAEFAQRAIREAQSAGRLRDPAIVLVHDVVVDHGQPWIVMDLATGRSLDKVIAEHGPLPAEHVARIGLRVLSALRVAHTHGMLHQDVKPGNILLDSDGTAMLTDFGIATPIYGSSDGFSSAGSPAYMAPERFNHQPAGPSSDLWSLGAALYAAVEGRGPFERPIPAAVVAAVIMQDPPFPKRAGRELGSLIMDLLAKDPARRPGADEVERRLSLGPSRAPVGRKWLLAPVALVVAGGLAWGGFAVLNRPAETGRFATAPDPCAVITADQAAGLLGGKVELSRGPAGVCGWKRFVRSTAERTLTLSLRPQRPSGRSSGPEVAKRVFDGERVNQGDVADLQGVGEAAYIRHDDQTGRNRGRSTVRFRLSNLLVEVSLDVRRDSGLSPQDRDIAQKAAQTIAKEL